LCNWRDSGNSVTRLARRPEQPALHRLAAWPLWSRKESANASNRYSWADQAELGKHLRDPERGRALLTSPTSDDIALLERVLVENIAEMHSDAADLNRKQSAFANWLRTFSIYLPAVAPQVNNDLYCEPLRYLMMAMTSTAAGTQASLFKSQRTTGGRSPHTEAALAFKATCVVAFEKLRDEEGKERANKTVVKLALPLAQSFGLKMSSSSLATWRKAIQRSYRETRKDGELSGLGLAHWQIRKMVANAKKEGQELSGPEIIDAIRPFAYLP
jgi:hypothetical protein